MDEKKSKAYRTSGKVLTITVGIPSSGKTTWALSSGFDLAVSLDNCRKILWGSKNIQNGPGGLTALLAKQDEIIKGAMLRNRSIVVHNTHFLRSYRWPLVQMARSYGYWVQIVYFDVPPRECFARNYRSMKRIPQEVMKRQIRSLEVPDVCEADLVIKYSEI